MCFPFPLKENKRTKSILPIIAGLEEGDAGDKARDLETALFSPPPVLESHFSSQ